MARCIEKLEDWIDYVPDVDDNREDETPMIMEISPMTAEELRAAQRKNTPRKMSQRSAVRAGQAIVERVLSARVRNVRNYVVFGKEIQSGEDLVKHGESAVIDDVFEALTNISKLSEGIKKKSASQYGSNTAVTPTPGSGAVANARAPSSETATAYEKRAIVTEKPIATSDGIGPPTSVVVPGPS